MKKKTWKEFKDAKLLWWVNRSLHIFGWAIVVEEKPDGSITSCYPARISSRGFAESDEDAGFEGLTQYMANESPALLAEVFPQTEGASVCPNCESTL